jgi:RNA ligase (TIGR02306 family)
MRGSNVWDKGFIGNAGDDATNFLGITMYLSPSEREEINQQERKIREEKNKLKKFMMRYSWFRRLFLPKNKTNGFPYWVKKTDEERIQNLGDKFIQANTDREVYVTEKIDYQSATFTSKRIPRFGLFQKYFTKVVFVVCSRNFTTNNKSDLYWQIARKYDLEHICREYPGIIIQGEQGNIGVQGNKYGLKEPKMWVFNIIDSNDGHRYSRIEMEWFCFRNKLDIVPIMTTCKMSDIGSTVADFVEYSKGQSVINLIHREGVVIRSTTGDFFSFKSINPEFLIKYE